MKPQDVIKQLVGEFSGWDEQDFGVYTLYDVIRGSTKFSSATVDFKKGIVQYHNDAGTEVLHTYAIKATLERIV